MSDTSDRVKSIIVEHLGVDAEKVTDTASFIDDLGADSFPYSLRDSRRRNVKRIGVAVGRNNVRQMP